MVYPLFQSQAIVNPFVNCMKLTPIASPGQFVCTGQVTSKSSYGGGWYSFAKVESAATPYLVDSSTYNYATHKWHAIGLGTMIYYAKEREYPNYIYCEAVLKKQFRWKEHGKEVSSEEAWLQLNDYPRLRTKNPDGTYHDLRVDFEH